MTFTETPLAGAFTIELAKIEDERGFFARFFCADELGGRGLEGSVVQINTSLSTAAGTLRGIHYQIPPRAETKIIRCIRGSLYDVIVDLRPHSPTFLQWFAVTLSAENRTMLYVPKSFGHAFLTLEDDTEVLYLVSEFYSPEHERGIRWNDPRLAIDWPADPVVVSAKDMALPDFDPAHHLGVAMP